MYADIRCGDALGELRTISDASIHCCVTSPPYYGLRDYGHADQIGLEDSVGDYIEKIVSVFREVFRVLRHDGTCWINLGDTYAANRSQQVPPTKWKGLAQGQSSVVPNGLKPKDLIGIPWRVAFALQADGWYLRQDIIWAKPNPMPESVKDRCTKSHEYIFLLSKSPRYFYDIDAVKEDAKSHGRVVRASSENMKGPPRGEKGRTSRGLSERDTCVSSKRNKRSVWNISAKPYPGSHFAVFPPDLIRPCIRAGTSERGACSLCGTPLCRIPGTHIDTEWEKLCPCTNNEIIPCTVLDPFAGSGTTGVVAKEEGRSCVMIELNPEYIDLIKERLESTHNQLDLFKSQGET